MNRWLCNKTNGKGKRKAFIQYKLLLGGRVYYLCKIRIQGHWPSKLKIILCILCNKELFRSLEICWWRGSIFKSHFNANFLRKLFYLRDKSLFFSLQIERFPRVRNWPFYLHRLYLGTNGSGSKGKLDNIRIKIQTKFREEDFFKYVKKAVTIKLVVNGLSQLFLEILSCVTDICQWPLDRRRRRCNVRLCSKELG